MSGKAALDGSAPVRGGIPIVFPAFAYPSHPEHLKQGIHGFARNEQWKLDSVVMDNEAGVSVRFSKAWFCFTDNRQSKLNIFPPVLQPTPAIKAVWTKDFELAYVITLAEKQLTTDLIAKNTSATESFEFQSALHTYIRAPSKDVRIAPLTGLNVINKVKGVTEVETRELVDVTQWTDSIYENVPDHIEIIWPAGGVQMRKSGFKTLVVWNPQAEAGPKIVDMNEGGW